MPYIKRDLEQIITKHLATPEIIAILSPRPSGETTLMRHILDTNENALNFNEVMGGKFTKLVPLSHRPYGNMYIY